MEIKNKIFSIPVIVSLLISIHSCNRQSEKYTSNISIQNDSIKGQAFIGKSNTSVNYSPNGNFIQVIKPDSGIWTNLIIKKSNVELKPKLFFQDDDDIYVSLIYDSLSFGEYDLKFVSDFRDTVSEKLNLVENIKIKFPKNLSDFYEKREIEKFDINELTQKDTLQISYKNFGCFGGSEYLIEFMYNEKNQVYLRKKINGVRYEDEPEDEWIYSKKSDVSKELNDFIEKIKTLDDEEQSFCSSQIEYILKFKGKNKVYWLKDKSCEFDTVISELIKTR